MVDDIEVRGEDDDEGGRDIEDSELPVDVTMENATGMCHVVCGEILNYDFRNPFVVCGETFTPIYRGQKDVSCPYCTTHFVPSIQGNLCTICELAVVGSDASRLLCSTTQIR